MNTGQLRKEFLAFEAADRRGSVIALGDADGDGYTDILVGTGPGHSSRVRAFNRYLGGGSKAAIEAEFSPFEPTFLGGVSLG
jgi:hypothetical protein